MFNKKKYAKKNEETNELRLEKNRKKMMTSLPETTGNLNDLLSESRKENDIDKTTEGQLSNKKSDSVDRVTDGQLSKQTGEFARTNTEKEVHNGLPINNLAISNEKEKEKIFDKKSEKSRNTEFWDKYVGDQLDGESTKQISQSKKDMIIASLKDADAMIYHIFYTASGRELTEDEKTLINGINSDKIKILSTLGK